MLGAVHQTADDGGRELGASNRAKVPKRHRIDRSQLERLRTLLARLSPGPRILVTHYPLARSKGQPERRLHGLRDWREAMRVADEGGVSLWLHGHLHRPFALETAQAAPFPIICAGSATQTHIWAYNEYAVAGEKLKVVRRAFSPPDGTFQDRDVFEVDIRTGTMQV